MQHSKVRHIHELREHLVSLLLFLVITTALTGCVNPTPQKLQITPDPASVVLGAQAQFTAEMTTQKAMTGVWTVSGGSGNGTITQSGLYAAPVTMPTGPVWVSFKSGQQTVQASVVLAVPDPILSSIVPTKITTVSTPLMLIGSHFLPNLTVEIDGDFVKAQVVDDSHVKLAVTVAAGRQTPLSIQVFNGDHHSAVLQIPVSVPSNELKLSPASISGGAYTLTGSFKDMTVGAALVVNGQMLGNVIEADSTVSGSGFLPPWLSGTVHVDLVSSDRKTVLASAEEPITPTAVPFDTAARFATQAGFGPRPDVILHIQQVGLEAFLDEQLAAPLNNFDVTRTGPVHSLYLGATTGSSLLRLRAMWGFQTYMPGEWVQRANQSVVPWEQTLERDAFTNYRQILLDAASDPNIAYRLNLAGNVASTDPATHPNQNFGREVMQLFSLGTVMLNDDGSPKLDTSGKQIPAYSQDDVVAMSRIFTGWDYPPPVDPKYTIAGIDFSKVLTATEAHHDTGAKVLFGSVHIPAGLTAAQDRDSAIDAMLNHPNVAPFVSRLLIQRFIKSQPSPAYVKRIAGVFNDNGSGTKGDLSAVIRAILLDPEARAGDEQQVSSDGIIQDPITMQLFFMSALQISGEDDQPTYTPTFLGEGVFNPPTIFSYFSPSFIVPGTQINSPEFELFDNFSAIQRSWLLYNVSTRVQPGYNNGHTGWLYDNFSDLPSMVDALNHVLFHGTMSQAEQDEITRYCSAIPNPQQQLETAVFLALNSDGYSVVQ